MSAMTMHLGRYSIGSIEVRRTSKFESSPNQSNPKGSTDVFTAPASKTSVSGAGGFLKGNFRCALVFFFFFLDGSAVARNKARKKKKKCAHMCICSHASRNVSSTNVCFVRTRLRAGGNEITIVAATYMPM